MNINHYFDDISFSSLRHDIACTSWKSLRRDFVAGMTVALLTVPQTMAYALIAGLPVSCGIFAAIFSAMIASLCGSSRHLVLGPSNAIAILIQAGTAHIMYTHYRELGDVEQEYMAISILVQLCFLIGIFQLICAFFKLGRLTQFVSHPVIVGYLIGVATAVIVTQMYTFLGIPKYEGVHATYDKIFHLFQSFREIHWPTASAGLLSLFLLIFFRKIDLRVLSGVITLVLVSLVVHFQSQLLEGGIFGVDDAIDFERQYHVALVGDAGLLNGLIPHWSMPFIELKHVSMLIPFAFAVSLLSVLESTSVAKSIAATSGQRLSMNQEILGLSIGNFVSSMVGAMPISGSPSRSALNYQMGAQTSFSAIFSAFGVAVLVYIFEPLITQIPLAALAALVLVTVVKIVDRKHFQLCLNATSSDAFVLWVTVCSCLIFSLDIAFYIGVVISITLYLHKAADPQVKEYDVDDRGLLQKVSPLKPSNKKEIRFIKVEGELFFGAADIFHSTLKVLTCGDEATKVVILQLKNARDMDATACLALQQLHEYLHRSAKRLIICGITPVVWSVLSNSGLVKLVGKENLYLFDENDPHKHMVLAMDRARVLVREGEDIVKIFTPSPDVSIELQQSAAK